MSNINRNVETWKNKWSRQQSKNSLHPLSIWQELADIIIEGRLIQKNNPLVPIGHYASNWPGATEFLVTRNNRGINLEKQGQLEAAVLIYEVSIADAFHGTHPYDRLRIIYTKWRWYQDAIRVCQAYLDLPDRMTGQNKAHFEHHLKKLQLKQAKPHDPPYAWDETATPNTSTPELAAQKGRGLSKSSKIAVVAVLGAVLGLGALCGICGFVSQITGGATAPTPVIARLGPLQMETDTTPTTTTRPTETPQPTPAAPLSPEDQLQVDIENVLNKSNRDVPRITEISSSTGVINIKFTINDNLSEDMIKSGAKMDIADILKAVAQNGVEYNLINIEGTFSMIDQLGNSEEKTVAWATYDSATVSQINWDNFQWKNVYNIATTAKQVEAFQE